MTTGARQSAQELDAALARAVRQLIASSIEADGGAGETPDAIPAA